MYNMYIITTIIVIRLCCSRSTLHTVMCGAMAWCSLRSGLWVGSHFPLYPILKLCNKSKVGSAKLLHLAVPGQSMN